MCQTPNVLADGQLVACRKCGQCRSNRIDEWVGRCIAESKTAVATTSITLTYGRDKDGNESHARAAILTYSDVQKYFKQLRKRGFPCKFLMTGEMGSKKGRAHWHGIVFWLEDVPTSMMDYGKNSWTDWKPIDPVERPIEWNKRFHEPCWVHGYSHWVPVTFGHEKGSIAYACKYIQKELDDPTAQTKLAMSKRPPLGSEYFIQRAQKFVDERIAPRDPFYQFPNQARRKNGNIINFMLRGKLQNIFLDAFIEKWNEHVGGHLPSSEYLEEYQDWKFRKESDDHYQYVGGDRYIRHPVSDLIEPTGDRWAMHPPFGYAKKDIQYRYYDTAMDFDAPCVETPTGYLWYGLNKEGKLGWREEIEKINPRQGRGGGKHCAQPIPNMTQSQWVETLSVRHVYWISTSVTTLGRYRQSKSEAGVWLRSLTQ